MKLNSTASKLADNARCDTPARPITKYIASHYSHRSPPSPQPNTKTRGPSRRKKHTMTKQLNPPVTARAKRSNFVLLALITLTALVSCPSGPVTIPANVTINLQVSGQGTILYAYSAGGSGSCSSANTPCAFTAPSGGELTVAPESAFGSSVVSWTGACDSGQEQGNKLRCTVSPVNANVNLTIATNLEVITTGDTCTNFERNDTLAQAQPRTSWIGYGALCGEEDVDLFTLQATPEQIAEVARDQTKVLYMGYFFAFKSRSIYDQLGADATVELISSTGEKIQSSPNEGFWDSHIRADDFSSGFHRGDYVFTNPAQRFTLRVTSPHGAPRPPRLEYQVGMGVGVGSKEPETDPGAGRPTLNSPRTKFVRAGTITEALANGTTRVGYNVISVLRRSKTQTPQRLATGAPIDPEYQRSAFNEHSELKLYTGDAATLTLPDGSSLPMLQAGNVTPSRLETFPSTGVISGALTSSAYTQDDAIPIDSTQRLESVTNLSANFYRTRQTLEYRFTPVAGAVEYTATMTSCAPGAPCRYFNFPSPLQSTRGTLTWWREIVPGSTVRLSITASNRATRELQATLPEGQWNNSRVTVTVQEGPSSPDAPTITSLSRTSGSSNGAGVLLRGTNLQRVTGITAGSVKVTQYRIISDSLISLTMPAYYLNGPSNPITSDVTVPVIATNPSGPSNGADFTYRALGSVVDLDIVAAFLAQSAQDTAGSVPMIKGKKTVLWVWCSSTDPGISVGPSASASAVDRGGASLGSLTVPKGFDCGKGLRAASNPNGPSVIVPDSWNAPGVTITVNLNADRVIRESRYDNNSFTFTPPDPISVPPLEIVIVPFRVYGETPDTGAGNLERLLAASRRLLPVKDVGVSVHATMQYADVRKTSLSEPNWYGEFEDKLLRMVQLLQYTEDGSGKVYVAFPPTPSSWTQECQGGVCGLAVIGQPALLLFDYDTRYPLYRPHLTLAHELGHAFGREHSYCSGNEPYLTNSYYGCDANYPFQTERRFDESNQPDQRPLGTFTYNTDITPNVGMTADGNFGDLMNGSGNNTISTYTYDGILENRNARADSRAGIGLPVATPQNLGSQTPGVVITGSIGETGTQLDAPISAGSPYRRGSGRYTIEALDANGNVISSNQFTPTPRPSSHQHDPGVMAHREPQNFSFITSLPTQTGAVSLRLRGMGGQILFTQNLSKPAAFTTQSVSAAPYTVTRTADKRTLSFDASRYSAATASLDGELIAVSSGDTLELPLSGTVTVRMTRGLETDTFTVQ